ncbi:MAG: hypothetical protein M3167_06025 [Acidobacteriota bacterium]|nr:hypothetical protein [Acidobacteriota bacterium]
MTDLLAGLIAEDRKWAAETLHGGYTVAELREAFSRVQNAENWKFPVDTTVAAAAVAVLEVAIPFMTGSVPTFRKIRGTSAFVVRAAGYYAAVGA